MIMDIDLLSRMVGELIVDHDQVGLPGVGTFVAEMVPASFSDKGFTINPPYRRLSFRPGRLEDKLLIDFYASSNHIPRDAAATYLTQFLAEMRAVLEERKSITLPGLGRLRATRENALFFVPEEGLDIFPGGVGLRPVSLKSHVMPDDPVVINVPPPVLKEEPAPAETVSEPERQDLSEAVLPDKVAGAGAATAEETPLPAGGAKRRSRWWIPVVAVAGTAVLALAVFMILARVAPDFIDSLLYTPEELRIINY